MHVRLLQQKHDAAAADGGSVSSTWQSFLGMLWSDTHTFGPLLMVAVEEEAAAATAAAAEQADVVRAVDTAAASQPTAPQLFSLCISAVKVLSQRVESPFAAIDPEDHQSLIAGTAVLVLGYIQQTAAAVLTHSIPSEALSDGKQRSVCSFAAGVPWAVLLLRCVQLGASWLQLVTPGLLQAVQSSSSSSSSSLGQLHQHSEAHSEVQEMLGDAANSVRQMADALYVLKLALASWCAEGPAGGQQPAAAAGVLLPLLQQHQQQLQLELLPALEQVLRLWEAGNANSSSSSSSSSAGDKKSITELMQSLGVLSGWNFGFRRDNYSSFARWQATDGTAASSSGDSSAVLNLNWGAEQTYQHLVGKAYGAAHQSSSVRQ
jgi:hypothetical protein